MRVLVIDDKAIKDIEKLKQYAEKHVIDTDTMLDIKNGDTPPIGDNPNHVIFIEHGYRVVYSIEQLGVMKRRHISISVEGGNKDKMPSPEAFKEILEQFGMDDPNQNHIYLEEEIGAVNAIAPFEYKQPYVITEIDAKNSNVTIEIIEPIQSFKHNMTITKSGAKFEDNDKKEKEGNTD